jgi:hypothetical protein
MMINTLGCDLIRITLNSIPITQQDYAHGTISRELSAQTKLAGD